MAVDKMARIRNRCIRQLKIDEWYESDYVAEVMGAKGLTFDHTVRTVGYVAEIKLNKSRKLIKIVAFKDKECLEVPQGVLNTGKNTSPYFQYTKCIRTLIEDKGKSFLTSGEIINLYLGEPLTNFYIDGAEEFNNCLLSAAYSLVTLDMYNIDRNKSSRATKKYWVKDKKLREANAAETELINLISKKYMKVHKNYLSFSEFEQAKVEINFKLVDAQFVGIAFEIAYFGEFARKEEYTVDNARREIVRKWDSFVSREAYSRNCVTLYQHWRNKFIEPCLIENKKGA